MRAGRGIRTRAVLGGVVVAAAACLLTVPSPEPTVAAWVDTEHSRGTVAAGVVNPPTAITCSRSGSPIGQLYWDLSWTPPTTGLPAVRYRISMVRTAAPGGDGNRPYLDDLLLPIGVTSVRLYSDPQRNPPGSTSVEYRVAGGAVDATGRGIFQVVSVEAGGWSSVEASRFLRVERNAVGTNNAWVPFCS
ncbi:hypothetical protein GCM10009761_09660 [Agromyces terreus]